MAKRNSKGQFVRGSGGGATKKRGSRSRSRSVALVPASVAMTRPTVHHYTPAHHGGGKRKGKGGRRRHHGGGVTATKIIVSGLVLGSVAETNNGPLGATAYDLIQKLPGAKTFGGAVTAGLYLGALGKTGLGRGKLGPWLRTAGVIGLVGAALKIGAQGTKFAWLGGGSGQQGPFHYGQG